MSKTLRHDIVYRLAYLMRFNFYYFFKGQQVSGLTTELNLN